MPQAQVSWFKNDEFNEQLLEAPELDEGELANKARRIQL